MKPIYFMMILSVLFIACNNDTDTRITNLQQENERLRKESVDKDSTINTFFESYNSIEENLATIKQKENILNQVEGDVDEEATEKINQDIQLINDLIEQNKNTIGQLRRQLKNSKLAGSEMEKALELMTAQIEEKDAEILALTNKLEEMDIEIKNLNSTVDYQQGVIADQSNTLNQKDKALNTAYYVFGTEKELKANGVISKEGGFIGIGKTRKLSNNFNKKYFTKVDIRELNSITLNVKKAKIITNHPSNSYKLVGEKNIERLDIENNEDFWSASKYLVIIVD